MTTDLEPDPNDTTLAFISPALPIEVQEEDPVDLGERSARLTYDWIVEELATLRSHRDEINTEIQRLVEAEQVWRPIVARLDTGIRHRKPKDEVPSLTDQGGFPLI